MVKWKLVESAVCPHNGRVLDRRVYSMHRENVVNVVEETPRDVDVGGVWCIVTAVDLASTQTLCGYYYKICWLKVRLDLSFPDRTCSLGGPYRKRSILHA